jgi:hypothetical protein
MIYSPLCDDCKRYLERVLTMLQGNTQSNIVFHGKYLNGTQCKSEGETGKGFCIQRLIKKLAEDEEKE